MNRHVEMVDFDNFVQTTNQSDSEYFTDIVKKLESEFNFLAPDKSQDFTSSAFIPIYNITKPFYKAHFPIIHQDYIPLYFSLWKLSVQDMVGIQNIHQDGGIHYFSRDGYQSRMVTLWTNLYKDTVPGLSNQDLGIFIIDNQESSHHDLYIRMAKENTHFYQKSPTELLDIRQLGDISISYDLNSLKKKYFDYSKGTTIQFNSHLLHGSKPVEGNAGQFQPEDLAKFRVSLTSVWIHKDDINKDIPQMREQDYEQIYLSHLNKKERRQIKDHHNHFCVKEHMRLHYIIELIRAHAREKN